MSEFDRKELVAVNLKYGSSMKPLKTLAFAMLSAKALYWIQKPLNAERLASEIAALIGVKNVSKELVEEGLAYLMEIGKVKVEEGRWTLLDKARKEIRQDIDSARYQLNRLIERHFPETIDKKRLKNWFKEASADFFGSYGDEWVAAADRAAKSKALPRPRTADDLLDRSIKKHGFEEIERVLIDGFIEFISSTENADQQYLMLISQAMFSARLVAADVGADPLTLEELTGSRFILDTNVLFAVSLERHKESKSINSLEEPLRAINSDLAYLHGTREEYGRALAGRRGEILHLAKVFPGQVVADISDDFIATARSRGCSTVEDYERFFDSLIEIPTCLGDACTIDMVDDREIEQVRETAEKDTGLKRQIQKYAAKMRPKWKGPKSEAALNHDAALLRVADFLRSRNEKCWILSLDRSLQACSLKQAGPHGMPNLLSVSALIEILAVNNAGPQLDATDFAPLLARIILNECTPPINTYLAQDLILLHKINEKAAGLPPDNITDMVKEIIKARISGETAGTRLALKINRMYQESISGMREDLEGARKRVTAAEQVARTEIKKRKDREKELITLRTRSIRMLALRKLFRRLAVRILIAVVVSAVFFFLFWKFFDFTDKRETIEYVLLVLPFLAVWAKIPRAFLEYRKSCAEAEETARKELK